MRYLTLLAALPLLASAPCRAQTSVKLPAGYAPGSAIGFGPADGTFVPVTPVTPLPTAGKQEVLPLATANAAATAVTAYGGDYLLSQTCASYGNGSLALQVLGPDGATYQTVLTRSTADSTGPSGIVLGSSAVVRVTLPAGSTGCAATLSRVP